MRPRILFVDDDDTLRKVLARELEAVGFEVLPFASAEGVLETVRAGGVDALLVDLRLPGVSGLELLKRVRAADEDSQVVVLTGHGAVPEAVEAMKAGARDFLTKPVRLDVLEQVLRQALEQRALLASHSRLQRVLEADSRHGGLLGQSAPLQLLREEIRRMAAADTHVLVQGENGTGKELVARQVHALSARSAAPFVVVNCGAIPQSLFESELFGHEKGAFTGADRRRIGLYEAAHGGTLFLDEVGELPKAAQATLLRALQFGELRPVGSDRTRRVDVRVVAATNRDLARLVRDGEFREDLYYRVAALVLRVPALRERAADVPLLAEAFLARSAQRAGRRLAFEPAALERLARHAWPGNVRELENAIERLVVMAEGETITTGLVERYVLQGALERGALPTLALDELEKLAVRAALERHAGDKKAAAEELGVALKTLYNMLDRHGLRPA